MFAWFMAYNNINYIKRASYILNIYQEHKQEDVSDTFIVRRIFPKHNIFISYRAWMYIKNRNKETVADNQLALF